MSLTWTAPAALWLLAVVPLVWAARRWGRTNFNRRQQILQASVRSVLLVALAIALARPVISTGSSRLSVVYVVDLSHSISSRAVAEAADRIDAPRAAVLRGGMVLPAVDGRCVVGATYDLEDEDPAPRVESHVANLERAARILPGFAFDPAAVEGRVAFRAVTADRLPVAGRMQENVFAAFAYGSRGLLWSTLAAELIASELEGEPLPVEGTLADAVSPARFARRAARRGATAYS